MMALWLTKKVQNRKSHLMQHLEVQERLQVENSLHMVKMVIHYI